MAEQTIRKNVVQGTGVRRIIGDIRSSAEDPGNLLLVLAILFALAVLIALFILTVREYFRLRKKRKKMMPCKSPRLAGKNRPFF